MSATLTSFPKPKWGLFMWYDAEGIIVEMPTAYGDPYYIKYPFSQGGLSKALALMKFQREECNRKGPRRIAKNDHPMIKKPVTAGTNQDQRDRVRDVLRKRGIL